MIIDTSAVLVILFAEDDAECYADAIAGAEVRLVSAANYLEAGIVEVSLEFHTRGGVFIASGNLGAA